MCGVPLLVIALGVSGCGVTVPSDPQGTLDRVRGGVLHAVASISGELVTVDGSQVGGSLAELVEGFAESVDAKVEWLVGSEEDLVHPGGGIRLIVQPVTWGRPSDHSPSAGGPGSSSGTGTTASATPGDSSRRAVRI